MPGLGWVGQALWEVPEVVRGGGQGSSWSGVSNEGQPEAGGWGGGEGGGEGEEGIKGVTDYSTQGSALEVWVGGSAITKMGPPIWE